MKKKNELTKAEMRVAIARDAIKRVMAFKYEVLSGVYLEPKNIDDTQPVTQELLKKRGVVCQVCAAGGLLASGIRLFNRFDYRGNQAMNGGEKMVWHLKKGLTKWFSKSQIALIETAFERVNDCGLTRGCGGISDEDFEKARNFTDGFETSEQRFILIMKNIIGNGCTFKP